jgi:hypothetical protein
VDRRRPARRDRPVQQRAHPLLRPDAGPGRRVHALRPRRGLRLR